MPLNRLRLLPAGVLPWPPISRPCPCPSRRSYIGTPRRGRRILRNRIINECHSTNARPPNVMPSTNAAPSHKHPFGAALSNHGIDVTTFLRYVANSRAFQSIIPAPTCDSPVRRQWPRGTIESVRWNYLSFPNLNGCIVKAWEWINNFVPNFIMDVIAYPCCWDYSLKGFKQFLSFIDVINALSLQK